MSRRFEGYVGAAAAVDTDGRYVLLEIGDDLIPLTCEDAERLARDLTRAADDPLTDEDRQYETQRDLEAWDD
jgi:hypothetical protein